MEIKSIIQASANIVRVTELAKGNVVKMVDEDYSSPEVSYAVVTDILNDGENVYVEFLKYKKSYRSVELQSKVLGNNSKTHLFPATTEDLLHHIAEIERTIREEIKDKREEADKKEAALDTLLAMVKSQQVSDSSVVSLN